MGSTSPSLDLQAMTSSRGYQAPCEVIADAGGVQYKEPLGISHTDAQRLKLQHLCSCVTLLSDDTLAKLAVHMCRLSNSTTFGYGYVTRSTGQIELLMAAHSQGLMLYLLYKEALCHSECHNMIHHAVDFLLAPYSQTPDHLSNRVQGLNGTRWPRQLRVPSPCTDVVTLRQLKVAPWAQDLPQTA